MCHWLRVVLSMLNPYKVDLLSSLSINLLTNLCKISYLTTIAIHLWIQARIYHLYWECTIWILTKMVSLYLYTLVSREIFRNLIFQALSLMISLLDLILKAQSKVDKYLINLEIFLTMKLWQKTRVNLVRLLKIKIFCKVLKS